MILPYKTLPDTSRKGTYKRTFTVFVFVMQKTKPKGPLIAS